jgi:hypothetical protein
VVYQSKSTCSPRLSSWGKARKIIEIIEVCAALDIMAAKPAMHYQSTALKTWNADTGRE